MGLLDLADIDDVRNGLLLFKPIQWAFNTSQLCFKLDPFNGDFVPHLLNNILKEVKLIVKLQELCAEEQAPTDQELQLMQERLKMPITNKDITFGDLPTFSLKTASKSKPEPFVRVLEFYARRASIKARMMGWPHDPVVFTGTGSLYQSRAKVLAWFDDLDAAGADEAHSPATDVPEALQQLVLQLA